MTGQDPRVDALLEKTEWNAERKALRAVALDRGLTEKVKWGKLCYTFQGANVAIVFGLKEFCGISFLKGALMRDPGGLLVSPGKNSQAARYLRFADVHEIAAMLPVVKAYVDEAIAVEKAGLKVDFKEKNALVFPEELQRRLDADHAFKAAFLALTPGRQRGYNLFFTAPRQSATRDARIAKCADRILAGKGLNDR